MTVYIALLRAVNVGGTGKLPMAELRNMCQDIGFADVQTYIASGNVVFASSLTSAAVQSALQASLQKYAGKPVGVIVRTAEQMQAVLDANPFADAEPSRTLTYLLDRAPVSADLSAVSNRLDEELALGPREIYVYYPSGMGRSKLKIPAAATATARNMNTLRKLLALSAG